MSKVLILVLFVSEIALLSQTNLTCNYLLMQSFDMNGQESLVPESNHFCNQVVNNCCGYATQLEIYKKWIVKGEKKRIQGFYQKFSDVFNAIFDKFLKIEIAAKVVNEETETIPGSNCNKFAKVILEYKISEMKETINAISKNTFDFLLRSRQGFYCSLCDADMHPHYNYTEKIIETNYDFCGKLVEHSLGYFLFRYKFFVKIARLYSQFLMNCDFDGHFFPQKPVPNEIKFFKKELIISDIQLCKNGFNKPGAMNSCRNYCQRFHPVKYDQLFEGELDKLYALDGFLHRRIRILRKKHQRHLDMLKEDDSVPKRILEEKKTDSKHSHSQNSGGENNASSRKMKHEKELNEVNPFNREFKTVLVSPLLYKFKFDTTIKYDTHFDELIMEGGTEQIYNLLEFSPKTKENGIDYHNQGNVRIDKDIAATIFELLNPDEKDGFNLEDYLVS